MKKGQAERSALTSANKAEKYVFKNLTANKSISRKLDNSLVRSLEEKVAKFNCHVLEELCVN